MTATGEWQYGNFFHRGHVLVKGERVDLHPHNFDHETWVWAGTVRVTEFELHGKLYDAARLERERVCFRRKQTSRELEAWELLGKEYVDEAKYNERLEYYQEEFSSALTEWSTTSMEAFSAASAQAIKEGLVRLTRSRECDAGTIVGIDAFSFHELEGLLAYNKVVCSYAHRDPQGRVTQQSTGFVQSYL